MLCVVVWLSGNLKYFQQLGEIPITFKKYVRQFGADSVNLKVFSNLCQHIQKAVT